MTDKNWEQKIKDFASEQGWIVDDLQMSYGYGGIIVTFRVPIGK
jgi:endo-1,4-beta-D-glucanase Y